MAVRVRLTRVGSKKNAIWRVVVADQRSPRDGRFIEMIGHYNPQTEPSQLLIDRERLDHWLGRGAEPSNAVRKLMRAPNSEIGGPAVVAEPESVTEAEPAADATLVTEAEPPAAPEPTAEAEPPAAEPAPSEPEAPETAVETETPDAGAAETPAPEGGSA